MVEDVRSLVDGPSPAVLMTYRKDGSAPGFTRHVARGQSGAWRKAEHEPLRT